MIVGAVSGCDTSRQLAHTNRLIERVDCQGERRGCIMQSESARVIRVAQTQNGSYRFRLPNRKTVQELDDFKPAECAQTDEMLCDESESFAEPSAEMRLRGKFLLQRLKDELSMYRILYIACMVAAAACVVLAVAGLMMGRDISGAIPILGMLLFFIPWGLMCKKACVSLADIYAQVGDDPIGIVARHDFPRQTVLAIVELERPAKEYKALFLAYGFSFLLTLAGAIVLFLLVDGEPVFIALSTFLLLISLWLGSLTFQAIRNYRTECQLNALHTPHAQ